MNATEENDLKSQRPVITQAELRCLLEILKQSELDGCAATNRIACELQVKPPTVCRMLDRLLGKLLISREPYGKIELTQSGREMTRSLRSSITAMQKVLMCQLHLNPESALQAAMYIACSLDEDSQHAVLTCVPDCGFTAIRN